MVSKPALYPLGHYTNRDRPPSTRGVDQSWIDRDSLNEIQKDVFVRVVNSIKRDIMTHEYTRHRIDLGYLYS
jgi:hypothetical protein